MEYTVRDMWPEKNWRYNLKHNISEINNNITLNKTLIIKVDFILSLYH